MRERCFCSACVPTTAAHVCSACGEEIRWGWRDDQEAWWHRAPVDHAAVLGHSMTRADFEAVEAALDLPRTDANGQPYTTREFDFARMKKAARDAAEEAEEEGSSAADPIPPPEVLSTPIEKTDPRLPGGAKQIWNLAEKNGWTARATYSRGPRVHASLGTLLSISDYVVLRLRLDTGERVAVGSWEDGSFDFAYKGVPDPEAKTIIVERCNSKALKDWIKGE